jgi:UDP-glucose 4-epimerase
LQAAGYRPVLIDDFSNSDVSVLAGLEAILGERPTFYRGDCGEGRLLRQIFGQEQIGGVIHFAAFKAVGESQAEPLKYYRNNLVSLLTLLEVMESSGVRDLIFSSSCTVYGEPDHLPVTEFSPIKPPESVYGHTKQIGEAILRDTVGSGKMLRTVALRYFNPVGAHPSGLIGELPIGIPNNLLPYVTQTGRGWRERLTVFGGDYPTPDGTCIRDYIHVMDLAEAHVAALSFLQNREAAPYFEPFNIGTGRGNSVLEVIQAFDRVSGQSPLPYVVGSRRAGDVAAVYADAEKAAATLGWRAQRSLETAIQDAWNWQQKLPPRQD